MKPKIFIGIDVSKDKLDIAVKAAETGGAVSPAKRAAEKWTAANTKAGCDALVRRLEVMHEWCLDTSVPHDALRLRLPNRG